METVFIKIGNSMIVIAMTLKWNKFYNTRKSKHNSQSWREKKINLTRELGARREI